MFAELTWALMILTFFIVFGFVGVILYFGKQYMIPIMKRELAKDEVTDMMNADWGFRLTNALKRAYAKYPNAKPALVCVKKFMKERR